MVDAGGASLSLCGDETTRAHNRLQLPATGGSARLRAHAATLLLVRRRQELEPAAHRAGCCGKPCDGPCGRFRALHAGEQHRYPLLHSRLESIRLSRSGDGPVEEALASVDGHYSTIFSYDNRDSADPWKVFDASAPPWVNDDLKSLEYGSGYWIKVTMPITLQIKVASDAGGERPALSMAAPGSSEALGRRNPPAVYFGTIQGSAGRPLAPGQAFTAEIDGQQCGVGKVLPAETGAKTTDLRYLIKVAATELGSAQACGMPGKDVTFRLGDRRSPRGSSGTTAVPQAMS